MKRMFRFVNKVVVFVGNATAFTVQPSGDGAAVSRPTNGKHYAIPVSYGRDEMSHKLICMTDVSGVWWKNLLAVDVIEISLKGKRQIVSARVEVSDHQTIRRGLAGFCRRSRVSAFFAGVSMRHGEPVREDLAHAARHVLIELGEGRVNAQPSMITWQTLTSA